MLWDPVKLRRASCRLSDKGKQLLELYSEVDADLLREQLECLKLLEDGKKFLSDIPEGLKPTLQGLVKKACLHDNGEGAKAYEASRQLRLYFVV